MFDKDISQMDFKELRNAVQLLYDMYVRLKRSYEDQIYNLDGQNFSKAYTIEQNGMKAQVAITADKIKTMVSRADLDDALEDYSTFEQTADAIKTAVHKGVDFAGAVSVSTKNEFSDKSQVYLLDEKYYYYNSLTKKWEECGEGIYTVFAQTAYGFQLKGDVLIDGNVISNASIRGGSFSDANEAGVLSLSSLSGYADLTFTSNSSLNAGQELFKIYEGAGHATLYLFGQEVCIANQDGVTFSGDLEGPVVAVFG